MHGLEVAKLLGYTGCMTWGHPDVYKKKMGFLDCRELGIGRDDSVDEPEGCVFAIEIIPGGFEKKRINCSVTLIMIFHKLNRRRLNPKS